MKRLLLIGLLLLLVAPAAAFAEATEVTSTDLIEKASSLDGETVVYTGEVIGDVLLRGDHAWVNVSDGGNAVGVWIDADMLGMISTVGRYGQVGDILQITGVFHRACREHGGDMDIHAKQIVVTETGYAAARPASGRMILAAILFAVFDIAILIVYIKKRRTRGMV